MLQINDSNSDSSDGCSHKKQRKLNVNKNTFKENVLSVLQKVENFEPSEFAVYGKLDAPMITVSMKNVDNGVIHFPLYESNAGSIIELIEQSLRGNATGTAEDPLVKTSWRLEANAFEISNPTWDKFINQVLVPRIKKEMFVKCSFSAHLNGLLLCKTGSLPRVQRDSETSDTMFGTLLIQLPSDFKGGQLTVRYDKNKTKTMDFSSHKISNSFSTFFCSFNRNCQLQGAPILEGYRLYLIYDLMSNEHRLTRIASQKRELRTELLSLFNNWDAPSKLVYALKHKYAESNLYFEHLNTTDKSVANFLLDIAQSTELHIFLGILSKKFVHRHDNFRSNYEIVEFDLDDEESARSKTYTLSNLVAPDGSRILTTSNLNVSLHQEVIPDECFKYIINGHEPEESSTFEIYKCYRIPAIVILPKHNFLQILKIGGATSFDIDMIFLKEIEQSRGWENDKRKRDSLLAWAREIVSLNNAKSLNMIKGIVALDNLELIKALFGRCVVLNESSVFVLEEMCEKYGWKTFASDISSMFYKLSKEIAVQLLSHLIGTEELQNEKQKICHDVMKIILDKFEDDVNSPSAGYVPHPTQEVIMRKRKNDEEILLTICHLSKVVSYNMLEFAKTKSVVVFVPVLFKLVSEETTKLSRHWSEIADYYIHIMEEEARKPEIVPNWRQMNETSCSCNDCLQLNGFLGSDIDSIRLSMGKKRRRHLEEQINCMKNISYTSDNGGNIGALLITKNTKTGDSDAQHFSRKFLEKLRFILP